LFVSIESFEPEGEKRLRVDVGLVAGGSYRVGARVGESWRKARHAARSERRPRRDVETDAPFVAPGFARF
jgi:hypothetical protein